MNVTQAWRALPPEGPCSDPDGHSQNRLYDIGSDIPTNIICSNCGEAWGIVVFSL